MLVQRAAVHQQVLQVTRAGAAAAARARVAVATPHNLPNRFKAVRSAASSDLAGPRTVASTIPAAASEPSGT